MACLDNNMYNPSSSSSEHINTCPPLMSPRISFSNDFAESHYLHNQVMRSHNQSAAATCDFEFSANKSSMSMTTADELFFKGQLLPFKPNSKTTTLRDELLFGEDDQQVSFKPPKSSTRWKTLLGLKNKKHGSHNKSSTTNTSQQEMLSDGGSSCRDVEIGR